MPDLTYGPKGWTPDLLKSLVGKTYVITGGNAGAGYQAVRILLSKGARVIMLNRSVERSATAIDDLKGEYGASADVCFLPMDLSDLTSVRAAAAKVLEAAPQIDALICNAAIAQVPTRTLTVDGFESQLGVNNFGHFVLSGLLFDRLDQSKGRIVVVASLGYNLGLRTIQFDDMHWERSYSANAAYSQSKLAQMMFAYELQDRIKSAGKEVHVFVCHPGASATSLISTSAGPFVRWIWWLATKSPLVQTAEKGAIPEVMCATENGLEQRALYGPTGRMQTVGPVGKGVLNPHAYDKVVMTKLWDASEQATGFTWTF